MSALNDMYDGNSIEYKENESVFINVDSKIVSIDLKTLTTKCEEDDHLEAIVSTVIKQLKSLS
jgi:hypothetical protein